MWQFFNRLLGLILLIFLAPLFLLVAGLVLLSDGAPVFFLDKRVGKRRKLFNLYKFRTMKRGSDPFKLSRHSDPRITRLGLVLRVLHLDELPQLLNVLRGEMALVGPRPENTKLDKKFRKEIKLWRRRYAVLPGITGLAQIKGVTSHNPKKKARLDSFYAQHKSVLLDLKILVLTLGFLFKKLLNFCGIFKNRRKKVS